MPVIALVFIVMSLGFTRQFFGIGLALIRGRQGGVHIEGVQPCIFCTADVGVQIVADHQASALVQSLLFQEGVEEPDIRLPAPMIRGNVDLVKLLPQTKMPQLILCEDPLGVAQQPQSAAFLPKFLQSLQHMGIELHILKRQHPEQLGGADAQRIGRVCDSFVPEQLGEHLLKGDIREAFVALTGMGFLGGHLFLESGFQGFAGIPGTVETEIDGSLFPNSLIFFCVDIHEGAVQIKNQVGVCHRQYSFFVFSMIPRL